MLPPAMEGKIEDTVDLDLKYPSVSERYWTKFYFIPNDKRRQNGEGEKKKGGEAGGGGENGMKKMEKQEEMEVVVKGRSGTENDGDGEDVGLLKKIDGDLEKKEDTEGIEKPDKEGRKEDKGGSGNELKTDDDTEKEGKTKTDKDRQKENKAEKNGNHTEKMDVDDTKPDDDRSLEDDTSLSLSSQADEGGTPGHSKHPSSHGHVCIMVHTNKLCLVTLSPKHPALAPGMKITQVSFDVGKFNRLHNKVSGKGKRGAQMMGPQSPVCVITCADGSRHTVLAGVHGKLVEVNEQLLKKPHLVSERPDAEGYLAVILPPLRNGDAPLKRLLTSEEYWSQEQ